MSEALQKPKRRWSKKRIIFLSLLAALIAGYLIPFTFTYPEQDACTFGPVSNARYRELLALAKHKQETVWLPNRKMLDGSWNKGSENSELNRRIDDMTQGMTSIYERIAAMHAVMRAMGNEYRQVSWEEDREIYYAKKNNHDIPVANILYEYSYDINRFGSFGYLLRYARIGYSLNLDTSQDLIQNNYSKEIKGYFSPVLSTPNWIDYSLPSPRSKIHPNCPPVPTQEWVEKFGHFPPKNPRPVSVY